MEWDNLTWRSFLILLYVVLHLFSLWAFKIISEPRSLSLDKTIRLRCFVLRALPSSQVRAVGIPGVWEHSVMPSELCGEIRRRLGVNECCVSAISDVVVSSGHQSRKTQVGPA